MVGPYTGQNITLAEAGAVKPHGSACKLWQTLHWCMHGLARTHTCICKLQQDQEEEGGEEEAQEEGEDGGEDKKEQEKQ